MGKVQEKVFQVLIFSEKSSYLNKFRNPIREFSTWILLQILSPYGSVKTEFLSGCTIISFVQN